jgi:prepilin signal peptidase PulO-like enzyme (type II secretory pathway)
VELLTGLLFLGLGYLLGWSLRLVPALAFGSLLLAISATDLELGLIPNRILYPALPLALLLSPLWPIPEMGRPLLRAIPPLSTEPLTLALGHSLLGGVAGFLVLLLPWRLFQGGMGGGDVKLAGLVGLMVGLPLILLALALSFVMGGAVSAVLLSLRVKGRKDAIPFGPFLAAGGLVAFLWGEPLLRWYLRM